MFSKRTCHRNEFDSSRSQLFWIIVKIRPFRSITKVVHFLWWSIVLFETPVHSCLR